MPQPFAVEHDLANNSIGFWKSEKTIFTTTFEVVISLARKALSCWIVSMYVESGSRCLLTEGPQFLIRKTIEVKEDITENQMIFTDLKA